RGLRFLLAHGSPASGLHVECLDAAPEEVAGSVRARRGEDGFDEPDAIFVAEPVRALEVLGELADLGEEVLAPCLAALAPELLGSAGAGELAERAEREEGWPEPFLALRARPSSRWLCLALNDVAMLAEGASASRRSAFGSAVWGLAALLSSSYAASGAFARAVGKAGALSAPAAVNLSEGPKKGALVPTEAFLAIPAQKALAAAGLLALGSVQDSDRLVLSAAPMLSSEAGAAPLPAQILTGRIVRFARWAKRQIDPARPAEEVGALFREAAALFLFPGLEGAAALGARVEGAPADRVLHVAARVKATHALVPLDIEFTLPLEEGPSQLGR
ncbi:MAG TPA: hypothetical protein VMG32_06495, partial [Anaeromyxobacteraceae bacterium]|nr:hypothetical protein [Anaeromyxobacteraceae bacterium]